MPRAGGGRVRNIHRRPAVGWDAVRGVSFDVARVAGSPAVVDSVPAGRLTQRRVDRATA